jgi:hypothetical protein
MHRLIYARAFGAFAMLGFAAPTPSAHNVSTGDLAVNLTVAASCRVSRQAGDASNTSSVADLVSLECANGAMNADPQLLVTEPAESAPEGETAHRVVTINF